jgi:hypothetical protein
LVVPTDPAAEEFKYPVSIDIREDLISLEDAMEELNLGPNGWVAQLARHFLRCKALRPLHSLVGEAIERQEGKILYP